jgi:glutathione peroxidase
MSPLNDPYSTIYDFSISLLNGSELDLNDLRGRVILFVNTASHCGFTQQYQGLEKLYQRYKEEGFIIVGAPCNQFGQQEPGTPEEILNGCLLEYQVSFPITEKIDVNGVSAHPLFQWLRGECRGLFGSTIKWNFTKFLVDKQGRPIQRFAPITSPGSLESKIQELL